MCLFHGTGTPLLYNVSNVSVDQLELAYLFLQKKIGEELELLSGFYFCVSTGKQMPHTSCPMATEESVRK